MESIQAQSHENWICVVSFDSEMTQTTGHPAIIPFLKDKRFVWIQNPSRFGHKKNFENAIRIVLRFTPDAIAFSDQDDVWYPEKLSTLAAELNKRGPGSLVHSDMDLLQEGTPRLIQGRTVWELEQRGVNYVKPHELITRNVVTGAASMFDAEIAERFVEIPTGLDYHDHWFALVAAYHGGVFPVTKPLYAYRLHSTNVVGVTPFRGFLRFPTDSNITLWPDKFAAGWQKVRDIALAAQFGGLNLSLRDRILHVGQWTFGVLLFFEGFTHLFSDRPLARYFLIEGLGKMMSCLTSYRKVKTN